MSSDGRSRLARWAQRKAEAKRRGGGAAPAILEEPANVPAMPAEPTAGVQTGARETGQPGGEPDLPEIESLTADSDFSVFMKDGVPVALRRLALRKLWTSDPMFNVIDEMVEYGEDYTDAATVVAGMKSAWEAGRGYASKTGDEDSAEGKEKDKISPDAARDGVADVSAETQTALDEVQAEEETRESG